MIEVASVKRKALSLFELMITIATLLVINSILVIPVFIPALMAVKRFALRFL